jgi:hypothetical protein
MWLAVVGLLAIVVVIALAVGWVRRTTGQTRPGGTSADVKMRDGDDTYR